MKKVGILTALTFIFLLFIACVAHAEIYKWVDENGKVHYSDRKSSNSAEELNVTTGTSSLGADSKDLEVQQEQTDRLLKSYEADRIERKEKREKEKQVKEKRNKYCLALKDQLRSFEEERAIWYDLDKETGERRYISDDDLKTRISELRKEINSNCS